MEDEEDLIPLSESIFEGVINQSLNQSSDALLEDSFSEIVDCAPSSTPAAKKSKRGKKKTTEVSSPSSRVLRSHSPAPSSPGAPSSPSQLSASPRRSLRIAQAQSPSRQPLSPAPASPANNSSSPSRRSQRLSSLVQPLSPQQSNNQAPRNTSPRPSTSRDAQQAAARKPAAPKRIKCRECPATLANEKTFAVHKKLHSLKRALAKVSSPDDFTENIPILLQDTIRHILKEPYVGTYANEIRALSECLLNSLSNLNDFHDELFKFLHSNLYPLVTDSRGVFSSSLSYVFHVGVNKLLNNQDFVRQLKMHILGLDEVNQTSDSVMNIFVGSLMLNLGCVAVVFLTKKIHGSTSNDEIRRKRSADKLDSVTFLQLCYHIGGCVVYKLLYKGERYKEKNPAWEGFVGALKNKFKASETIGNKCADEVSEFTREKDKGGYTHITQEALDFFVVIFDLLTSLEDKDGSLPPDLVTNSVLDDNVILCLWDVLVGCELDEDSSLDFLIQVTEVCAKIVVKGIMVRRLNEHLKKAFDAVSLRSRLSE